ncbi:hypothetical protein J3458_020734 [Metarhizium acridum]|uniref:uncharacterized protein n=1 Tax=Metarhizium acridum TaxID=92637 RepID=UPI001C6B3085|nr:hypothetical protein J3458_020734 [Metarhizium acridum]
MEFSLTLGSVGEIIAVSQIILELRHSLGTSAESARQYKELRDELDSFVRILMQVIATYEQYEPSPWLDSVEKEIKLAIHDCAGVVRGALERFVPKYNQSLQPGGSGRMLRDVFKKVEWVFAEKKNLDKLHNKLRTYSDRIALLVAIAGRQSARVDNRTVLERIEKVSQLLANHEKTLTDMHEEQVRLCLDISNRLVMMERDSHTILPWVKMTYETVGEIKEMVGNVTRLVASMQSLASDSLLFRTLDPTREKPVLLEDPLGHIVEIPMDWIHDWSVCRTESILRMPMF